MWFWSELPAVLSKLKRLVPQQEWTNSLAKRQVVLVSNGGALTVTS